MSVKEIVVLPKREAAGFSSDRPWAAISIVTQPYSNPQLQELNRVDALYLHFADVARPDPSWVPQGLIFDQSIAGDILDFVEQVWDKIDVLMVHCEMGISRSPATAAAIAHCYHGPETENLFFNNYTPNTHVYKTILQEYYRRNGKTPPTKVPESHEEVLEEPWNVVSSEKRDSANEAFEYWTPKKIERAKPIIFPKPQEKLSE